MLHADGLGLRLAFQRRLKVHVRFAVKQLFRLSEGERRTRARRSAKSLRRCRQLLAGTTRLYSPNRSASRAEMKSPV